MRSVKDFKDNEEGQCLQIDEYVEPYIYKIFTFFCNQKAIVFFHWNMKSAEP